MRDFFFQAEHGIRYDLVTGVRRVLFRSIRRHRFAKRISRSDLPARSLPCQWQTTHSRRASSPPNAPGEIDRKSVVSGKSVDLGGRRIIKRKREAEHSERIITKITRSENS